MYQDQARISYETGDIFSEFALCPVLAKIQCGLVVAVGGRGCTRFRLNDVFLLSRLSV